QVVDVPADHDVAGGGGCPGRFVVAQQGGGRRQVVVVIRVADAAAEGVGSGGEPAGGVVGVGGRGYVAGGAGQQGGAVDVVEVVATGGGRELNEDPGLDSAGRGGAAGDGP